MIRFVRDCQVADIGAQYRKDDIETFPEELEARLIKAGFAVLEGEKEPDVTDDFPPNEEVVGLLSDANKEERDEYFDQYTVEQLNAVLLERFDVPISNRNHGQAANMLMNRLGIGVE